MPQIKRISSDLHQYFPAIFGNISKKGEKEKINKLSETIYLLKIKKFQ